jgi:hypothetical protein
MSRYAVALTYTKQDGCELTLASRLFVTKHVSSEDEALGAAIAAARDVEGCQLAVHVIVEIPASTTEPGPSQERDER